MSDLIRRDDDYKKWITEVCSEPLFDESIPSLGIEEKNSPAYLCYEGLLRMAQKFKEFPDQYEINIKYLKENDPDDFTDWKILEKLYHDTNTIMRITK